MEEEDQIIKEYIEITSEKIRYLGREVTKKTVMNVKGIDEYFKLFIHDLMLRNEYETLKNKRVRISDVINCFKLIMLNDTTWECKQSLEGNELYNLSLKFPFTLQININDEWVDKVETAVIVIIIQSVKDAVDVLFYVYEMENTLSMYFGASCIKKEHLLK